MQASCRRSISCAVEKKWDRRLSREATSRSNIYLRTDGRTDPPTALSLFCISLSLSLSFFLFLFLSRDSTAPDEAQWLPPRTTWAGGAQAQFKVHVISQSPSRRATTPVTVASRHAAPWHSHSHTRRPAAGDPRIGRSSIRHSNPRVSGEQWALPLPACHGVRLLGTHSADVVLVGHRTHHTTQAPADRHLQLDGTVHEPETTHPDRGPRRVLVGPCAHHAGGAAHAVDAQQQAEAQE